MGKVSRRAFLEQASAVSICAVTGAANAAPAKDLFLKEGRGPIRSATLPGEWTAFGRLALQQLGESVILQDGFVVAKDRWNDGDFRFCARAPKGTEEVQIWAGMRCLDRDRRYVFALRGGNNNDVYLARYAPDGGIRFLGIAPLEFHPVPETWYGLRVIVRKNRFQLYLNDESVPRINVIDDGALWGEGSASLGGGWLPTEFRDIQAHPLTQADAAAVDLIGDQVWSTQTKGVDREKLRALQRTEYRPAKIAAFDSPRSEISLDGKWLILPDQERGAETVPEVPDCDDSNWHLMDVPDFWTPCVTWLYGETGFTYLSNASAMKGISDQFYLEETKRLDGYTFDWRNTRGAWYRHYVDLPADIGEHRFEICFDAIAMISEVWVNGIHIASHTGMFGEVRHDVTSAMKSGRNVIAVHAVGQIAERKTSNEVLGIAVTVEVTASMLNSLPHGMYHDVGGIWQPVTLIVTGPVKVDEVYIQPRLDGLDCEVTVEGNPSDFRDSMFLSYSIRSVKDKTLLYSLSREKSVRIGTTQKAVRLSISGLKPELWSPQQPNLYELEITLSSGNKTLDRHITRFGFRTFATESERLLLNGKPFWLRGANHFPHALRPNDCTLARRFMRLAKEGNVVATRSHTAPFSKTWLEAADEAGIAVSFEGTWPWLMLRGAPPSEELIREWQDEFISLIRKYRNHPSIILWTVNNEMKFPAADQNKPEQLREKWQILTTAIKAIRQADPSRPVVCDSSYCRKEVQKEYDTLIQPSGFDDGDIDDAHVYPGWYNPSFFHYFQGEFGKTRSYEGRPLISQEMSTGYPRNDDGHPARFYLFKHYTPQSLVGDEAYENRNPIIFLKRQAFLTKELAEAIRRTNRSECSGIFHFAYLTWFKDVWSPALIRPFDTYHALKSALQPILVSAELHGRHFYAGSFVPIRVCIANDGEDGSPLPASHVGWEIKAGDEVLATGGSECQQVPYYSNHWINVVIAIPSALKVPRVDGTLRVFIKANGVQYSENVYEIVIATSAWASGDKPNRAILINPRGDGSQPIQIEGLRSGGSLRELKPGSIVVLGNAEETLRETENARLLKQFVNDGGRVLALHAGETLATMFPSQVKGFRLHACEIAAMRIPESPAFDGLESLDLAWWELGNRATPQVCSGSYQIDSSRSDVQSLADAIDFHGYLNGPADFAKISGSPLVEIHAGKGRIVASEMMLLEASPFDPIAKKLFSNLIQMLNTGRNAVAYAADRTLNITAEGLRHKRRTA